MKIRVIMHLCNKHFRKLRTQNLAKEGVAIEPDSRLTCDVVGCLEEASWMLGRTLTYGRENRALANRMRA